MFPEIIEWIFNNLNFICRNHIHRTDSIKLYIDMKNVLRTSYTKTIKKKHKKTTSKAALPIGIGFISLILSYFFRAIRMGRKDKKKLSADNEKVFK